MLDFLTVLVPHMKWLLRKFAVICVVATLHEAISFTSTSEFKIDCFVDSNFAGLLGRTENSNYPVCAKSRTGYVLTLADCALLWVS